MLRIKLKSIFLTSSLQLLLFITENCFHTEYGSVWNWNNKKFFILSVHLWWQLCRLLISLGEGREILSFCPAGEQWGMVLLMYSQQSIVGMLGFDPPPYPLLICWLVQMFKFRRCNANYEWNWTRYVSLLFAACRLNYVFALFLLAEGEELKVLYSLYLLILLP